MIPVLDALKDLGGSAIRKEGIAAVAIQQNFSDKQLGVRYGVSGVRVLDDRISWAQRELKKLGYVENPIRGVWALTAAGRKID